MNKAVIRKIKVDIIRDINNLLIRYGKQNLTTADFDILYDLDVDQLLNAQQELFVQMRATPVEAN